MANGLSAKTARVVAEELTEHDTFAARVDVELGIDPDELSNPWQPALSSAVAFTHGRGRSADLNLVGASWLPCPVAFSQRCWGSR
jgi:hypothetical protein